MKGRYSAYWVALVIFIADQLTKWIVLGPLDLLNQVNGDHQAQIEVLPFFNLTYTENRGTAFGLFSAYSDAARWTLVGFTAAIAIGVAWWITREKEAGDKLALGLVLGGALGNIVDRSRLGYVVDFADLYFRAWPEQLCWSYSNGACHPFLIFNVGDAAISIGVVILLLRALLASRKQPEENIDHA